MDDVIIEPIAPRWWRVRRRAVMKRYSYVAWVLDWVPEKELYTVHYNVAGRAELEFYHGPRNSGWRLSFNPRSYVYIAVVKGMLSAQVLALELVDQQLSIPKARILSKEYKQPLNPADFKES